MMDHRERETERKRERDMNGIKVNSGTVVRKSEIR